MAHSTCARILKLAVELVDPEGISRSVREVPSASLERIIAGDDKHTSMTGQGKLETVLTTG